MASLKTIFFILLFIEICLSKDNSKCAKAKRLCKSCDKLSPKQGLNCWLCGFCQSKFQLLGNFEKPPDWLDKLNDNLTVEKTIDQLATITTKINETVIKLFDKKTLKETANKIEQLNKIVNGKDSPSPTSLYLETDLLYTPEQLDEMIKNAQNKTRTKRKTSNSYAKWELNVRYDFDNKGRSNQNLTKAVHKAMKFWNDRTCLKLSTGKPKNGSEQYLLIVHEKITGCASYVGKSKGKVAQPVMLGPGCDKWAVAAHEIAHGFGLAHEQSRPDRDKHVTINWNNVKCNKKRCEKINFERCDKTRECHADLPYDFGSNMHYGRNKKSETLIPKISDYKNTMGSRLGPTFYDIYQVNKMYCQKSCKSSKLSCKHKGYPNPNNCKLCLCPEGFAGERCDEMEKGTPKTCGGKLSASSKWKSFSTPNYPTHHDSDQKCSWSIKTSTKGKVELKFDGKFHLQPAHNGACAYHFIEIRTDDMANTGPRFCGDLAPTKIFKSTSQETVVLLRSFHGYRGNGFQIKYRAVTTKKRRKRETTKKKQFCCLKAKIKTKCDTRFIGGMGKVCCRYEKDF